MFPFVFTACKNEPGICCVDKTDAASRIVFGILKSNKYVHAAARFVWIIHILNLQLRIANVKQVQIF